MRGKKATPKKLTVADHALVKAASRLIERRYSIGRHHIAAAVQTKNGKTYLGLHLDTYVGRASVCAEAVAVGRALASGADPIVRVVSVRHPRPTEASQELHVVSPCGVCRELLMDFAPKSEVILRENGRLTRVAAAQLLPSKYRRGG